MTPVYASTVGDFDLVFADGEDPQEWVDYTWTDDNTRGGVLAIISEKPMVVANVDGAETAKDQSSLILVLRGAFRLL